MTTKNENANRTFSIFIKNLENSFEKKNEKR